MKMHTSFFRSEKTVFFYWIILKSGRQATKRWRWWGINYEFISVRKGKIRLSDNNFVSLSKYWDVKLLLKWVFKIYPHFCCALISYSTEWKFPEPAVPPVSLELAGITTCVPVGSCGRKVFACTRATALQLAEPGWFKTAENMVHVCIVQLWCL